MWANQKPFLVAEEGPRRLKQNTKNTKNTCILKCGDVYHSQCQSCADHKHHITDGCCDGWTFIYKWYTP